jgi:ABC-2 type transport system ATP-binding protein
VAPDAQVLGGGANGPGWRRMHCGATFRRTATGFPEIAHDDALTDKIIPIANQDQSGRPFGCAHLRPDTSGHAQPAGAFPIHVHIQLASVLNFRVTQTGFDFGGAVSRRRGAHGHVAGHPDGAAMTTPCPFSARHNGRAAGTPAIELRQLTKVFPGSNTPALNAIDLTVPAGTIFGVLGPNGAGKTTIMSTLCGLLKPSSGSVHICGNNAQTDRATIKQILGMVPQEPAIYPTLTARENLEYFGRMQGLSGEHLQQRIMACLELAEMIDEADKRVERLSGGYKRRLNMVIGLIHEPRILILDEPTVAIDPHSRSLIHHRLRELHASGISILISTHQMDEAEQLCQEIAILDHGRVLVQGTVADLLSMQRDETIQLQIEGDPPADLTARLEHIPGVLEAHVAGRCLLVVADHPDQVMIPLMQAIQDYGLAVQSLSFGTTSLEEVFLARTEGQGGSR